MPRRYYLKSSKRHTRAYRRHTSAANKIKRAWKRRRGNVARLAVGNRRAIKQINRNIETKVIQSVQCSIANRFGGQFLSNASVGNLGTFLSMAGTPNAICRPFSGMGNGDLQSQRTGSVVNVKSLTCRIMWTTATAVASRVGCMVVLDRMPTDDPPTLTGLITADGTITDGAATEPYLRFQNMNTCAGPGCRFKVLKHLKGQVSSSTLNTPSNPTLVWNFTLKNQYKLRYDSEAASIEPQNQQLLLVFYSDSTTAITAPSVKMFSRLRFKDA